MARTTEEEVGSRETVADCRDACVYCTYTLPYDVLYIYPPVYTDDDGKLALSVKKWRDPAG